MSVVGNRWSCVTVGRACGKRDFAARLGNSLARLTEPQGRARTETEDRELAVLRWSADFADPAAAVGHAERMADPWFEINHECNAALNAEARQAWRETELVAACRELTTPTLVVDGAHDLRPRWAVDSLVQALPSATRVVLRDAGHVPWVEAPDEFASALLAFLH